MSDHLFLRLLVEVLRERGNVDAVKISQELNHLLGPRMLVHRAGDIKLDAVAGREQRDLGLREFRPQSIERPIAPVAGKCHLLAHFKRRRRMIQSPEDEALHQRFSPGMKFTATSVPIIKIHPTMLKIATLRPRKLGLIGAWRTIA